MNPPQLNIAPGSRVTLHFTLASIDGTEATSTFDGEPVTVVMGDGDLAEGLELALYGLSAGDRQTITLTPAQAFGPRDAGLIHSLPRSDFDAGMALQPGLVIAFEADTGEELTGTVLEVGTQQVRVDFNHPLAGQTVVFTAEILDVSHPLAPNEPDAPH